MQTAAETVSEKQTMAEMKTETQKDGKWAEVDSLFIVFHILLNI